MLEAETVIIGAGPAGISAALAAAQNGVMVTLVDESPLPGGQYLKGSSSQARKISTGTERTATRMLADLNRLIKKGDIALFSETGVWGIEGHNLYLYGRKGYQDLSAKKIIVASGAREFVLPFPGWTLPGILTLGAAQILAKQHRILPGQRVLLSGSGPLIFRVAHELIEQGANIIAILQAKPLFDWVRLGTKVWENAERAGEAWRYLRSCLRARIPIQFACAVVQATGDERVEEAVISHLDRHGNPISEKMRKIAIDSLCLGFGFVPNIKLTQLAGCSHNYDQSLGGWAPIVNARMETNIPGVYAIGETNGIGGASAALLEGRIAGLAVAQDFGYISKQSFNEKFERLRRSLHPLVRFSKYLNNISDPPAGLNKVIHEDTVVCRCEDITAGQIYKAVRQGMPHLDALKISTHTGQGPCQGRTCGPILERLVAEKIQQTPADIVSFKTRPPIKPIPFTGLEQTEI